MSVRATSRDATGCIRSLRCQKSLPHYETHCCHRHSHSVGNRHMRRTPCEDFARQDDPAGRGRPGMPRRYAAYARSRSDDNRIRQAFAVDARDLFVVNNTGRRLTAVKVTLTYHDMQGHQLHVSSHEIACDIPGGETRNASVPSWDRQRSFYYHLNRPWRPRTTATAFTVSATVDYAVCLPDK